MSAEVTRWWQWTWMGEDAERKKERETRQLTVGGPWQGGLCGSWCRRSRSRSSQSWRGALRRDQQPVTDSRLDNPHSPLGPGARSTSRSWVSRKAAPRLAALSLPPLSWALSCTFLKHEMLQKYKNIRLREKKKIKSSCIDKLYFHLKKSLQVHFQRKSDDSSAMSLEKVKQTPKKCPTNIPINDLIFLFIEAKRLPPLALQSVSSCKNVVFQWFIIGRVHFSVFLNQVILDKWTLGVMHILRNRGCGVGI